MHEGGGGDERPAAAELAGGFEAGPAPRDDPLAYPGALPAFSYLFTGEDIERLDAVDEEGVDDEGLGGGLLTRRLAELGATPMDRRHPVLAYGSNRSPAQLRSKFTEVTTSRVIPVVRARVTGLSVVFCAYLASYGSVPAGVVTDPGATTEVAVTFLDEHQLEVVDATEPGRDRPVLDAEHHRVHLLSGDKLVGCERYRSVRPVLACDGRPMRLAEVGSSGSTLAAWSQRDVHRELLGLWRARLGVDGDERAFVAAIRADEGLRRAANEVLEGLATSAFAGLGVLPPDQDA